MRVTSFRLAAAFSAIGLLGLTACGSNTAAAGGDAPESSVSNSASPAPVSDDASTAVNASANAVPGDASCNSDGTGNFPEPVPGRNAPTGPTSPSDAQTPEAAAPTYNDIAYAGTSEAQKLDLYLPEGGQEATDEDRVLIINIHGGAFLGGDKAMEASTIAHQLDAGYAAASLNYRLSCEEQFPAAVQDVKAAVRWLRAHAEEYGLDPERFVVWGKSAGGYMAQMVAITGDQETKFDAPELGNPEVSDAVQAAVIWFAPNDFAAMDEQFAAETPAACNGQPDQHSQAASPESIFLGAALDTIPDKVQEANPLTYIDTAHELPPFSIAAGDSDCIVPHQQSEALHAALSEAGAQASLNIVEGAAHGSDGGVATEQTDDALTFIGDTLAS